VFLIQLDLRKNQILLSKKESIILFFILLYIFISLLIFTGIAGIVYGEIATYEKNKQTEIEKNILREKIQKLTKESEGLFVIYNIKHTNNPTEDWRTLDKQIKNNREYYENTPMLKPTIGIITSPFGIRNIPEFMSKERVLNTDSNTHFHKGIDIACPTGTPIAAPADGIVTFAGARKGYGLSISIDHKEYQTRYGHCSNIYVQNNEKVKKGDYIADVGESGWASGSHLHYEIRKIKGKRNIPVDPMTIIILENYHVE